MKNIKLIVKAKAMQDPYPHGSALILASWIRIRIHIEVNAGFGPGLALRPPDSETLPGI